MNKYRFSDYWNAQKDSIKWRFNLDSDADDVPDYLDCKPFNPMYQHISRTMKERIKKLPIVASPKSIRGVKEEVYQEVRKLASEGKKPPLIQGIYPKISPHPMPHILSKEAKKQAPDARRLFLSVIKKHPGVVSEIERTRPKQVIVTSLLQPKSARLEKGMPVGWTSPTQETYIGPQSQYYSKQHKKKVAGTAYHELTHIKQLRKKPLKEVVEEIEKKYEKRPMEKEAMKYAAKKMREYHKGRRPSGKAISKILDLK